MKYSITNPNHAQSNHDTRCIKAQEKRRHVYMFTEIISIFAKHIVKRINNKNITL